jgi:hypothetical protein
LRRVVGLALIAAGIFLVVLWWGLRLDWSLLRYVWEGFKLPMKVGLPLVFVLAGILLLERRQVADVAEAGGLLDESQTGGQVADVAEAVKL